jgi:IS30 family transposase
MTTIDLNKMFLVWERDAVSGKRTNKRLDAQERKYISRAWDHGRSTDHIAKKLGRALATIQTALQAESDRRWKNEDRARRQREEHGAC